MASSGLPGRPPDLLLRSSSYQPHWPPLFVRHAALGIPIKPSTPITGVHILFKTAHLTSRDSPNPLPGRSALQQAGWLGKRRRSQVTAPGSSTSLLVWPQISYSALETPPFSKIKPFFTSGCVRTKLSSGK